MGATGWRTSTTTPESRYGLNSAETGLVNSVWSGRVETDNTSHANWATPQAYFASPLGENTSPQHLRNYSDISEERKYANAGNEKDNWNDWLFGEQLWTGQKSPENTFPDCTSQDTSPTLCRTPGILSDSYPVRPLTPPPASYLRECTDGVGHLRRGEREPKLLAGVVENAEVFDSRQLSTPTIFKDGVNNSYPPNTWATASWDPIPLRNPLASSFSSCLELASPAKEVKSHTVASCELLRKSSGRNNQGILETTWVHPLSVYHDMPSTYPDRSYGMKYVEKDHNEGGWEYDEVIKEEHRNGLLHSDQQWRTSSCQKARVQTEPSFPDPFPYLVKHSKPLLPLELQRLLLPRS